MRFAVCGGKGGCGKTTTALSLAGALVETRRSPFVIDCDRDMPNLHVYAGTQDEPGVTALADGASIDTVAHHASQPDGVRIIPGVPGNDVAGALSCLDAATSREPIVLDTPAGASEDVATPLRFADAAILVTTPSGPCVRAAMKTAAMARALEAPIAGVVVSRAVDVPPDLPGAVGVPRDRIVSVPAASDPLVSTAWRPIRRLSGIVRPNA